jgi:hypothetical protein
MALRQMPQWKRLSRSADRLKRVTNADIRRRRKEISYFEKVMMRVTNEEHRLFFGLLIDEHERAINDVRLSYSRWQTGAREQWGLELPDLV